MGIGTWAQHVIHFLSCSLCKPKHAIVPTQKTKQEHWANNPSKDHLPPFLGFHTPADLLVWSYIPSPNCIPTTNHFKHYQPIKFCFQSQLDEEEIRAKVTSFWMRLAGMYNWIESDGKLSLSQGKKRKLLTDPLSWSFCSEVDVCEWESSLCEGRDAAAAPPAAKIKMCLTCS